ncbi:MAG: GNAT family N-acetyltransferase [Chloroflexia bacterium]
MSAPAAPRDLGSGLVLRWATPADAERIAESQAEGFRDSPDAPPNPWDRALLRELTSGRHPLVQAEDFVIVEDTRSGKIVASACLMHGEWEYDGLPFRIGRPEHVVTDHSYRNRGLIRAIFGALHERSAAQGEVVQVITGIPYFYRQFGYEYALDLEGGRVAYPATLPPAPDGPEPFTIRRATPDDIPFIAALYDQRRRDSLVSARVPEAYWRYAFAPIATPTHPEGDFHRQWRLWIIEDREGATCGYVRTTTQTWQHQFYLWDFAVRDGVSLAAVAPPVLRAFLPAGEAAAVASRAAGHTDEQFREIMLCMEREHPLYAAIGEMVAPRVIAPYAWYVRVPDLPGFLRQIAPVLERRLADSALASYSGELRLDFFRDGLRLTFADGKLTAAEPWRRPISDERQHATFPPLVFLQLLFGHRSLDELRYAFPDIRVGRGEIAGLLEALFPKRTSRVAALE